MDKHPLDRPRIQGSFRCVLVFLAAGLVGLLGMSRWLEPDPRGYGTHTQLGLGPCAFAELTGRPCPTCGMTTSFAWFMRGRLGKSWQVSPAGCLIASLIPPVAVWLLSCSFCARPVGCRSLDRPLMGLLVAIVSASLVFWLIRNLGASAHLGLTAIPRVTAPG
jgi:hypothetical protein